MPDETEQQHEAGGTYNTTPATWAAPNKPIKAAAHDPREAAKAVRLAEGRCGVVMELNEFF